MNRIIEVEIAGKLYPLNFSTKAAKETAARYGSIENIGEAFKGKSTTEIIDELLWLLELLINQGAEYAQLTDGIEQKPMTMQKLEVLIGISDITRLKGSIMDSMTAGMQRTVEVDAGKNAQTTQDN